MEQLHQRYPEDREAGVFYCAGAERDRAADRQNLCQPEEGRRRSSTRCGRSSPSHPGVAHYLIHSDDSAKFAEAGLTAAMCYPKIAPAVPHALHMPSHIFTRLGLWRQSIEFEPRRA